ncbi:ABC-F family ATP-binding cassette domain-containing protein [Pseudomonas fragi]|uniref:ABC-F family ATP-binding cassette domain-containing protein n=1 Tax=Pseudomonas fragi TaxID=296 RepID=UPI0029534771|nr:ABC-F family ATP-binding cassette domain-containing protein [Pseudomonas fragi]WOL28051.1 ABC-F family ATP-binding cassette domain-containing protein [Pseudomonas fragi]
MAHVTSVTLQGVSYHLPDGSSLFSDIDLHLDQRRTGLVGRNGVGKSILARIMAGDILPSTGHCIRNGTVYYLTQQVSHDPNHTLAELAGVQPVISALERIERGSSAQADFDCVGERWNIRQQLLDQLSRNKLAHLTLSTPASALSGGEAMRVALLGAFLSKADLLILDEPTNHLDHQHRLALHEQLQQWPEGLLVISHDRALLENMERIVELSPQGLTSYGGGYSFYAQAKTGQLQAAQQQLAAYRLERKRQEQTLREQRESLERKQSRGRKQAADANQAKILLGRQKERCQASSGKLRVQQDAAREQLSVQIRQAANQVEEQQAIFISAPQSCSGSPAQIAELIEARLPYGAQQLRRINLAVTRGQRIALTGPNGCGKSTLLKVLAGQLTVVSGQARTLVTSTYLDQHLGVLEPARSVLEQLQSLNRQLSEGELRTRLAQLGLNADRTNLPSHRLSGGERLKAAMACVFYTQSPPQLLLLDEPANHLDLPSVQALESMLKHYPGTLIVTSHDDVFLAAIGITHRLMASPTGWLLCPV